MSGTYEAIMRQMYFLSLEEAATPSNYAQVIMDHWWIVDPEKGLMFFGRGYAPQCNSNQKIAESIAKIHPTCEVKHLELVYVPRRLQDWSGGY